ncbi:unnamed protein product [Symbiodinium necroappetens]|uniref:Uncharacterized protein n=1 Tax=Symbiodinium necroappetens TaxID=1628268 RepID=A0A812WLI8_9DINO|nr:unnamed protein product [Symbiodinium necroappetens]
MWASPKQEPKGSTEADDRQSAHSRVKWGDCQDRSEVRAAGSRSSQDDDRERSTPGLQKHSAMQETTQHSLAGIDGTGLVSGSLEF